MAIVKIADPSTVSFSANSGLDWVNTPTEGTFIAITQTSMLTKLLIYRFNLDTETFTAITGFPVENSSVTGVKWSKNGEYLAVGYSSPLFTVRIYKRTGTTFTILPPMIGVLDSNTQSMAWKDDTTLYVANNAGKGNPEAIHQITINGLTATRISSLVVDGEYVKSLVVSPDGQYLAAAVNVSRHIYILSTVGRINDQDGSVFYTFSSALNVSILGLEWRNNTILGYKNLETGFVAVDVSDPLNPVASNFGSGTLWKNPPEFTTKSVVWSEDGLQIARAMSISPYLEVYSVDGDTLTKKSNPHPLPGSLGIGVATVLGNDKSYFGLSKFNTDGLDVYSSPNIDTDTEFGQSLGRYPLEDITLGRLPDEGERGLKRPPLAPYDDIINKQDNP